MSKIDWMEQNLNILNQENNDFHLELETKESNNAQLSKAISTKDKTIVELRHYESLLTKRLTKTEELLEQANKTILGHEMKQINDQMERREEREALELEVEGLRERVGRSESDDDDVNSSLKMLARFVRFGDKVEKLRESAEFNTVKQYFTELDQDSPELIP